ncbi:unnamed protein product [Arctia plantaginis]|uniref:Axin n=1 Tax=Arctia plantaginis TaxID=874455 RepID=A0A8S1B5A3_ARCPL|nr:unnamed protein product [Arctia plantaginis]
MNMVVSRHAARGWEKGLCAMSHTPIGGHPQGWEHKLAERSSLPPASGEEKSKSQSKHVFTQPHLSKVGMAWREQTEGSSGSSARSPASPPYMRWARSLHELLEDAEGVRLFRKYVGGAGGLHVDRLNFYFAVQGLRQESDPSKIRQVVSAIYKFLRKSQLAMPEELKAQVKQSLKDGSNIEKTIFDNMEQEVTRAITESTYQSFLRSEAYVSYVSAATQPLSSPDTDPPHLVREMATGGLATLHEGQELAAGGAPPPRLTHDALLATQSRRLHSDVAPHRKRSVYSAHVSYGGYCPASRQDSERASLSSGRTDSDAVSLSGSSVDGMSVRGVRESRESRHRPRLHGLDRHAVINKEQDTAMVIPRTARVQSEQLRVLPPSEFAPLLIEKLERVRRDQDAKDRLEKRLAEGDGEEVQSSQALPPQLVAAAIREKLQLDDDNDQDILDQHVSRVWSERTPGASPPGGRRARPRHAPASHAPHASRRAPSALSADSGHYDAPPDSLHHPHSLTRSHAPSALSADSGHYDAPPDSLHHPHSLTRSHAPSALSADSGHYDAPPDSLHHPHSLTRSHAPSALSADSGHYDAPPDSLHHPHSLTRSHAALRAVGRLGPLRRAARLAAPPALAHSQVCHCIATRPPRCRPTRATTTRRPTRCTTRTRSLAGMSLYSHAASALSADSGHYDAPPDSLHHPHSLTRSHAPSALSADSGHYDAPPDSLHHPHSLTRSHAPSALSADSGHYDAPPDSLHHPHSLTRRSFSKKTVTELTDSGVSVVSEGVGVEPRILLWMAEGERLERRALRDLSRGSSADRDEHRRKDKQQPRTRGSGSKSSSTSGGGAVETHTVVVVTFLDENVPYRFKVPASPLTLKTFKEYLPRKGNYRYFFKTNCADLDTVIQEEVSCDSETLPMFEGKVMARVKSID